GGGGAVGGGGGGGRGGGGGLGLWRGGGPAAGHDLDVVRAFLEELAHLRAHRGLAVRLRAEVAHVAARHRDGPAADHHAGPGSEATPDALAQGEGDLALGPVFPEGGDAGVEQRARVLSRLEEEDVVVLLGHVVAERAITGGDEVRVGVDQTRQHGRLAVVVAIDGGAVGRANLGGPAHLHDAPVLH